MKNRSKFRSGAVKAALILSSLTGIQLAYAAELKERSWGGAQEYRLASSVDRVAHFQKNLKPHANIRYSNDAYHKTIVRLSWFDQGRSRRAIVNRNRTLDIFGLFEGSGLTLSPRAMAILDDLGAAMGTGRIHTRNYVIAAHSATKETKTGNQQLSVQRAQIVKAYLRKKFNISDKRLVPVGFGSYDLKDKQNVKAARNSRIELSLIEDIYGFTPKININLPDVGMLNRENSFTTTAGKVLPVMKEKRVSRQMAHKKRAHAKMVESHNVRPGATANNTSKKRRIARNSGAENAGTRRGPAGASRRTVYDRGYGYDAGYADEYRYGSVQSGPAYSYGGYVDENVRCPQ